MINSKDPDLDPKSQNYGSGSTTLVVTNIIVNKLKLYTEALYYSEGSRLRQTTKDRCITKSQNILW
jgi:hypothetical protein